MSPHHLTTAKLGLLCLRRCGMPIGGPGSCLPTGCRGGGAAGLTIRMVGISIMVPSIFVAYFVGDKVGSHQSLI